MKFKHLKRNVLIAAALILVAPLAHLNSDEARALSLGARSVQASDLAPSAVATYDVSQTIVTLGVIGSLEFEYCSNNPIPGEPCTPPVGFDASSASLAGQTGETGFSIHGSSTANRTVLTRAPAVATQALSTYTFDGITNPSEAQRTYYVRLATFAADDGTGARIDSGGVALTTSDTFDLTLYVPPYLGFCKAQTISGLDCSTAVGSRLGLGVLSGSETRHDTSEFAVTTNAANGYNVVITGPTLTSGNNTIGNATSPNVSVVGSQQFGLNLRDNSLPDIGENPTGLLNGGPTADYNIVDQFTYNDGDMVASSSTPDASSYTVSYIVNIPPDHPPGIYTTTLTYVAFASF